MEGESSHFTLFDTGPDSRAIARNLAALQVDTAQIERVILSHWHSDHSGGLLTFLRTRQESASASAAQPNACVVDLHPDRPIARGISSMGRVIGRLPNDPTFEEIRALGGVPETHAEGHAVSGGTVWVSGEIPRVTEFEGGLPSGVRWVEKDGKTDWVPEEVGAVDVFRGRRELIIMNSISWMNGTRRSTSLARGLFSSPRERC